MSSVVIVLGHPASLSSIPASAFASAEILVGCRPCISRKLACVPDASGVMTEIDCGCAPAHPLAAALPSSTYVLRFATYAQAQDWYAANKVYIDLGAVYILDETELPLL